MPYLCTRLRQVRAFSSAGLEHLPYKQRVGGSNPSTPTTEPASPQDGRLFCVITLCFVLAERKGVVPYSVIRIALGGAAIVMVMFHHAVFLLCQIVRKTCRFVASCFLYIPYFCDIFARRLSCSEKRQKTRLVSRHFHGHFASIGKDCLSE